MSAGAWYGPLTWLSNQRLTSTIFNQQFRDQLLYLFYSLVPAGIVVPYAGGSAPNGWIFCNGQTISRTTFDKLFAALGTNFGAGDGSTTFAVPDLRGRFPLGLDNLGGIGAAGRVPTATTLNASGGAETVTLSVAQLPSHDHDVAATQTFVSAAGANANYWNWPMATGATTPTIAKPKTGTAGSGSAVNKMPPYVAMNYLIKY